MHPYFDHWYQDRLTVHFWEEVEEKMKEERERERQRKEGSFLPLPPSLRPSVRATRRRSRHCPPLPQEKDIVKHFSQSTQAEIGIEITV